MPGNDSARVVRTYMVASAPTGEGERIVDEHGRVWRPRQGPKREETGVIHGRLFQGRIYLDHDWRSLLEKAGMKASIIISLVCIAANVPHWPNTLNVLAIGFCAGLLLAATTVEVFEWLDS